jgi:hypothetical protein
LSPKKAAVYNKEYIHIKDCKKKNGMEINSLVLNMKQIKLKENSDLTTQNRI